MTVKKLPFEAYQTDGITLAKRLLAWRTAPRRGSAAA